MLSSRMRSYELAARMQLSVPEVSNINGEPEHIRASMAWGKVAPRIPGRRCLLARRLLERGVRFVQIYSGGPMAARPARAGMRTRMCRTTIDRGPGRIESRSPACFATSSNGHARRYTGAFHHGVWSDAFCPVECRPGRPWSRP
ncbi:MAG: hypothetical protein Ct9H300mP32_5950 [Verrucomicrobiota bacterium]|nr:MAG: hypothetical protein Ct9H300mP32_5950 [Verrucomicrobiota bacterium]